MPPARRAASQSFRARRRISASVYWKVKLAIKAKYNTKIDELATVHEQDIINKQQEAMRIRFETEIAQAYDNEEEILRIRMEQKKAELDSLQQMEGESIEAFNLRKLEAQNAYLI